MQRPDKRKSPALESWYSGHGAAYSPSASQPVCKAGSKKQSLKEEW
jgi:hypothetical protein